MSKYLHCALIEAAEMCIIEKLDAYDKSKILEILRQLHSNEPRIDSRYALSLAYFILKHDLMDGR